MKTVLKMKPSRRAVVLVMTLAVLLAGVFTGGTLLPGSLEGVYHPFSSYGCDCDQFMEFRDGKVVTYVMDSDVSFLNMNYRKEPSGAILLSLSSRQHGEKSEPIIRAEPRLLGTRFFYLKSGGDEWFWKRFVTGKMRDHMAMARIFDIGFETEGIRFTTYDSNFNVIESTFRPRRSTTSGGK